LEAKIVLSYKTLREAEAVANAVSPDNVKVPEGLSIKTMRQGKRVLTDIECESRLQTFVATIDDLLSAVSVAERTLLAVKA
jgi:tRNA threonylcarbamoyladenosine modification (KEOPS) complex  Pcc1 subunit